MCWSSNRRKSTSYNYFNENLWLHRLEGFGVLLRLSLILFSILGILDVDYLWRTSENYSKICDESTYYYGYADSILSPYEDVRIAVCCTSAVDCIPGKLLRTKTNLVEFYSTRFFWTHREIQKLIHFLGFPHDKIHILGLYTWSYYVLQIFADLKNYNKSYFWHTGSIRGENTSVLLGLSLTGGISLRWSFKNFKACLLSSEWCFWCSCSWNTVWAKHNLP